MGRNKRNKKRADATETTLDPSVSPRPLGNNDTDSVPPLDGSDFSWLGKDTLAFVNDGNLYDKCMTALETLWEQNLWLGQFFWAVNNGNLASRSDRKMRDACTDFRGDYLIPTLRKVRIPLVHPLKVNGPLAEVAVDKFALSLVGLQLCKEMQDFEKEYGNVKVEASLSPDTGHVCEIAGLYTIRWGEDSKGAWQPQIIITNHPRDFRFDALVV